MVSSHPVESHVVAKDGMKEIFYLMTDSTHFIYDYVATYIATSRSILSNEGKEMLYLTTHSTHFI